MKNIGTKCSPKKVFSVLFLLIISALLISSGCALKPTPVVQPAQTQAERLQTAPAKPPVFLPTLPVVGKPITVPSIAPPEITIGLATGSEPHKISATGVLYLVRKDLGLLLYRTGPGEEISVTARSPFQAGGVTLFSIEVGSYRTEEEAKKTAVYLEEMLKSKTLVIENRYDHFFRVKYDPLPKDLADALAEKLASLGMTNIRVIALQEDEIPTVSFIRVFDAEGSRIADTIERLVCLPESASDFIRLDSEPYRGNLEIFINPSGKLTIINRLNLEDYLKGVVPGEMSGRIYPMIEALKAQAVAARTYAVKNLGQFAEGGYDLCATPLCQVYKGVSSEQEITNQAVDETAGMVATYNGQLINALYTSTCGGHTENVENIFPDINAPYLRGVTCYPETTGHGIILLSSELKLYTGDDGRDVNREAALLDAIGFIDSTLPLSNEPASASGLYRWSRRLSDFFNLRLKPSQPESDKMLTRWDTIYELFSLLDWQRRMAGFIQEKDTVDLNQFKDFDRFPKDRLKEISYLLREEIIAPFPDNTLRLDQPINYASLARAVYRFIAGYNLITLKSGIFIIYEGGKLQMLVNGEKTDLQTSPQLYLFYSTPSETAAADRLLIRPGDRFEFLTDALGQVKFINLAAHRKGVSDDRFSSYYYWKQSFTAEELNRQVNSYVRVGTIKDIIPLDFGVSGRIIKLKIIGTQGNAELKGLEIRRVLGIKENLFMLERIQDPKGGTAYYYFSGKGWGHGVGMCQVGAYGMALRGAKYDDILKHYYKDIEIKKIVPK